MTAGKRLMSTRIRRAALIAAACAAALSIWMFLTAWPIEFSWRAAAAGSGLCAVSATIAWALKNSTDERKPAEPGARIELKSPMRRTTLVGGAGFIGSVLVRELLEGGHRVTVLDRLDFGIEPIREVLDHPRFELVREDFRNIDAVSHAVSGADAVIHLGAVVGDPACAEDEQETLENNYLGVAVVGRAARTAGVGRLVFASTCSVYGAAPGIVDENSKLNPVSLYAYSKIDAENLLLSWAGADFHPVILRLGTAFGWSPRPRFDLVVNLLTAKAHFENKAVIFNGRRWRPFVHVADIARAFQLFVEAPLEEVSGQVFNVGDSRMNHRLNEVGQALTTLYSGAEVIYEATDDRRDYRVCFDKIRRRLGFDCRTSLLDGMREIESALAAGCVSDYRDPRYHNVKIAAHRSAQKKVINGRARPIIPAPIRVADATVA